MSEIKHCNKGPFSPVTKERFDIDYVPGRQEKGNLKGVELFIFCVPCCRTTLYRFRKTYQNGTRSGLIRLSEHDYMNYWYPMLERNRTQPNDKVKPKGKGPKPKGGGSNNDNSGCFGIHVSAFTKFIARDVSMNAKTVLKRLAV